MADYEVHIAEGGVWQPYTLVLPPPPVEPEPEIPGRVTGLTVSQEIT